MLSPWLWTRNDTERASRARRPEHRLDHYAADAEPIVSGAFGAAAKDGLLVPVPDFKLASHQRAAIGERTKEELKKAKAVVARFDESPDAERFLELVDFSCMAVHNGDEESRDNKGLRAVLEWTQSFALEALRRYILAGREAAVMDEWGWDPEMTQEHLKPRNRRGVIVRTGASVGGWRQRYVDRNPYCIRAWKPHHLAPARSRPAVRIALMLPATT